MEIEFLGVGEAFDPEIGNSSFLVHSETKLLIDCGYAVPRFLFRAGYSSDLIDAVYFTHFHADHIFGIPAVVIRAFEEGRTKDLTIVGRPGVKERVESLVELGYPGVTAQARFRLRFVETTEPCTLNELRLSFAPTVHSVENYALRVDGAGGSAAFSGDGEMTAESKALFQGCRVLVHEAFMLDKHAANHSSAKEVLDFAQDQPKLQTVCLVHINRGERSGRKAEFAALESETAEILVPDPGDRLSV